jgi:nucleotide-binding universal stress UspA family protein
MYDKILVTLDATPTDRAIIDHIKELARIMHSRLVLLHVATSAAAKWHGPNAADRAVEESQAYLDRVRAEFEAAGIPAEAELAYGDPVTEIVHWVAANGCDLVAMSTHGHQLLADLFYGTTASRVQHSISVPVLLLRARREEREASGVPRGMSKGQMTKECRKSNDE